MTQPVLLETQYLPPVSYFFLLAGAPAVYLEQQEHYVKGSYRNRCHIAAVNGVQRLSIPLRSGKNRQMPVKDVEIAYDEPWQSHHWHAIRSAYGNSPFFEHYADALAPFYKKKNYKRLWDWNLELLRLLMQLTKVRTPLHFTDYYDPSPQALQDMREAIHPKRPVEINGYSPVVYPQVFEDRLGFTANLSVIDLLFCAGPAASRYFSND